MTMLKIGHWTCCSTRAFELIRLHIFSHARSSWLPEYIVGVCKYHGNTDRVATGLPQHSKSCLCFYANQHADDI